MDLLLSVVAATATALLLPLIARDDIGMPPDMVREDALIGASIMIAAVAGISSRKPTLWPCEVQSASNIDRPKRLVTLRRDGDDFVVAFYPEDAVVFRHTEFERASKGCTVLQWKIISDSARTIQSCLLS